MPRLSDQGGGDTFERYLRTYGVFRKRVFHAPVVTCGPRRSCRHFPGNNKTMWTVLCIPDGKTPQELGYHMHTVSKPSHPSAGTPPKRAAPQTLPVPTSPPPATQKQRNNKNNAIYYSCHWEHSSSKEY